MESSVSETVEIDRRRVKPSKWYKNWKFITPSIIVILAIILGSINYYQANHFNANIKINDIKVSGLTADEALKTLKTAVLTNEVYVGQQQILDGQDTKMEFTEKDLPAVKKLLANQKTLFPSSKAKNYTLMPSKMDQYRSQTMKKQVEEKLLSMNKSLKAPQDAEVHLEEGKIVVSKSVSGKQYEIASLLKDYEKQEYKSDIHLNPVYIEPIKEDSPIIKEEKNKLEALLKRTVDYKVQDKVYSLKASDLIKSAAVTKDLKVSIDATDLKNKISEINETQSTLDKNFQFKTHSGSVISVKGEGYGWALDEDKEAAQLQDAFEKGEKSLSASAIIGHGWSGEGYGYNTTSNNGIGDTYAEVSIAEQKIWIYKNGKLVVTTNVVTGKHSTGEDTSKGVWYILYKRTPSTLRGSHVGSGSYEVEVQYWAPFTNSGQGFHDASWRSNWSSTAYLKAGSGGCVNTPSSIMKTVYNNLSTHEPVVIY
ncbi:L,D-transpeptidase/peptidoglycan binding protein [Neobacillus drentensis]|uniref:L,D-transpeptidase family protein n=1 Tax=Neobacillus drentensis TaxID=220684 RepID=UPI001F17ED1E|nr:L,D-transpeptidase family protein [Neobacillus drentensis]ULT56564.1 L,D-transpeptidase/peptidoglycan binding protein [Neobacillus drentensis]